MLYKDMSNISYKSNMSEVSLDWLNHGKIVEIVEIASQLILQIYLNDELFMKMNMEIENKVEAGNSPLTIADKILKEYDSNQNDPIHTILSEVLIYCIVFDDEYSAMSISEKDKENILKIYKIFGISKKDFEKKPSKESLIKKKYRN